MVQIVPRSGPIPFPRQTRPSAMAAAPMAVRKVPVGADQDTDLSGLLDTLRRNIKKIALATLLGFGIALAYLTIAKPIYSATASVFIDPRSRKVVSDELVQGGPHVRPGARRQPDVDHDVGCRPSPCRCQAQARRAA